MRKNAILLIGLAFAGLQTTAQQVKEPDRTPKEWTTPYQPFQIAGNLYYVGTSDLTSYLITTPEGNILINTGLAASASQIKANIEALGFKFADTKILLTNQAHYDHMGAMAAIKKATGAQLMINEKDAPVVRDGGSSDFELGGHGSTFAPVKPDRLLRDRDTISLGGMHLVMLNHPGHTKGSCSYQFTVKDKNRSWNVLIANMPTIISDRKFSAIKAYPEIAKDFAYTLQAMKQLTFDIWLAAHASQFALHSKHKPGDAYNPAAFSGRKDYDASLQELQASYDKKMKTEK
ncbi:subclass B3 metallo-beta-lactamase [Chitinophaga sp. Mgbs1]|uniref:Subclass B3 metallo-beta-lactamase n=1 Tax=Chitinophaga solisilvae TaxID=1233460 RepID=A0A433WE80_9BACT|nr:subclass B3 metallo-beta-lactamase [Chitinophaga solisilvae]